MTYNEIKKAIVSTIKPHCSAVFFDKSPATVFPKVDADLRCFEKNQYRRRYSLTLDVFVESMSRTIQDEIDSLTDDIIEALEEEIQIVNESGELVRIKFDGTRFPVPEKDNTKIRHNTVRFEVIAYLNKGGIVNA